MRKLFVLLLVAIFIIDMNAQTAGTLSVSTNTSQTSTPDYAPYHVIAIWIEDASGKFVTSLLVMGKTRKMYLVGWNNASGENTLTATTGATQNKHVTRTCSWNGKDANSVLVADGNYVLKMELTDNSNFENNNASFPFVKGSNKQTQSALSQNGFSAVSIDWTPAGTSVSDVEMSNKYQIYPSPTKSNIFVNGYDIKTIDILSTSGQFMMTSSEQNVDLSYLPRGVYLVSITTYSGNVIIKKVIKQ
jgi:hypothetical protein